MGFTYNVFVIARRIISDIFMVLVHVLEHSISLHDFWAIKFGNSHFFKKFGLSFALIMLWICHGTCWSNSLKCVHKKSFSNCVYIWQGNLYWIPLKKDNRILTEKVHDVSNVLKIKNYDIVTGIMASDTTSHSLSFDSLAFLAQFEHIFSGVWGSGMYLGGIAVYDEHE